MIKKIFLILFPLFAVFSLTGCNSTGRVHDKNYLRALSVRSEGGESTVTFSFFSNDVMTVKGESIDDIQEKAELACGREIFMGYTQLVVLDGCECSKLLELLLNDKKVSPDCIIAYSNTGSLLDRCSAETLYSSVKTAVKHGKSPECDIVTVLSGLCSNRKRAEIAEISVNGFSGTHSISA